MAHKFAEIAFTERVRDMQTDLGSRAGYASMDGGPDFNHMLSEVEADFIAARDSFYMATVSETGWPYVQHRGGPKGFVKIIDAQTIGFSDYAGNRQYVSAGNLKGDNRVSLFFMDYPNRRRLKMMGRVSFVDPSDLETLARLEDPNSRAPIERAFRIHIEAFDWNCPKYITPRYTDEEVETAIKPLKEELEALRATESFSTPTAHTEETASEIGNGPLPLQISAVRQEAESVRSYELRSPAGASLPKVEAGAHLQVPVKMPDGDTKWRHYSISSDANQQDHYQIAVLDQPDGRGGSHALHNSYQVGQILNSYRPGNYFALQTSAHEEGAKAIFIGGGIGITPIRSMVKTAIAQNYKYELHYAARSRRSAAFASELDGLDTNSAFYFSDEGKRLDLDALIGSAKYDDIVYICGPEPMIAEARELNAKYGRPISGLVFETFDDD